MPLARLLNVGYAHARALLAANCDRAAWAGEKPAAKATAALAAFDRLMDGTPGSETDPDRDSWGLGPAAAAGQDAMLALTRGG